jgi:hypothetical protein
VSFTDAPNGLFLAAPRRTGKSTFLQNDLKPALEREGVVVVYVDLWSDQRRDPGELISEAIGRALQPHLGKVAQLAKASGLESVGFAGWLKIDTSKIGRLDGVTLSEALRALHETSNSPVALIIDEAQHALTSEAGETAMSALKSARDQLNKPGAINLMLVMSGSDRDKLLRLVNTGGAPFYGSQIQHMPELNKDFIDHVTQLIEAQFPGVKPVFKNVLTEAFKEFGSRPQFFMAAVGDAFNPLVAAKEERFEHRVLAAALQRKADDEAQMESEYLGLKPLERAVMWRLLSQGQNFRPYDGEALAFYTSKTDSKITPAKVQGALEGLRGRSPALVWKSARGEYSLDDAAMYQWYEKRVKSNSWPPQGGNTIEDD